VNISVEIARFIPVHPHARRKFAAVFEHAAGSIIGGFANNFTRRLRFDDAQTDYRHEAAPAQFAGENVNQISPEQNRAHQDNKKPDEMIQNMNIRFTLALFAFAVSVTCAWTALAQGRSETPKETCERGYFLEMQQCRGIADLNQRWACEPSAKVAWDACMDRIGAFVPENPGRPENLPR
jgi:hypothetical protein